MFERSQQAVTRRRTGTNDSQQKHEKRTSRGNNILLIWKWSLKLETKSLDRTRRWVPERVPEHHILIFTSISVARKTHSAVTVTR